MAKDTIAFISTYEHHSRDSVELMIRTAFPEYQLQNIWLPDVVKQHREWIPANVLAAVREYGLATLLNKSRLRERYFQTSWVVRKIREAMRNVIDPSRHVFSFQTQSMYDTSTPGVPHFLYTDHTHLSNLSSPYFDRRNLRPPAWIAAERDIYHHCARVFTRSSDVTADLHHHYAMKPEDVACVYCGSNVRVPADFVSDNADYSNRHILFVGGDWERKGGEDLAKAFRRVLEVYPDAQLTIAGANPILDLPNCNVLGKIPIEQLTQHYARASLFCLPTRLEPFGVVFIEAMMHRLSIVGTSVGAVPDMVVEGVNGHLVPPSDPDALAQALIDLLGDPQRMRRFGAAGRQRAEELYTWERVGQRIRENVLPFVNSEKSASTAAVTAASAMS